MADILITFAIELILQKVSSIALQEIAGARGLKNDLQNLTELTLSIHGKVKEARNYEAAKGHAVKTLLVKLQDVLYSAEDVLEDFSFEILRRQIEIQSRPMLKIRGFASRNNPILFRLKMAHKVKKINESLADIEKQALRDFALTGKAVTDPVDASNDPVDRVTVSFLDKSEPPVIGRASEVEAIINMVQLCSSTPSLLTVVSIVGFGGLGKTTLAKMVLHQLKETTKLFDETIWVCVSEPFNVKEILQGMLDSLDETAGGLNNVDAILRHLQSKLKEKRFLLVLDDVWEDNSINCSVLRSHLLTICAKAGNFVIVTTRKLGVAEAMNTQNEHVVKLKELEDKECWDIIKKKCVMQWGGSIPEELEEIGVEVGKKCKGVPLAAKVIGGTLCKKKNREEWLSILNSDAWDQIDEHNEIFSVLKLSFHQLPPSLKQCFVFCSLFPKDYEYWKETLIEQWMAEGFLNSTSTRNDRGSSEKPMEAVGGEFFNDLIVHSFFQDVQVDEFGNIITCKMHDLLHDVATSVSNYKGLKWKDETTFFIRTSYHQHQHTVEELEREEARNVRCVISKAIGEVSNMFSTFKSLRSLKISHAGLKELPRIIGRLKHLRYLDISGNKDIKELPEFITKLYNLETIRLIGCLSIRKLPTNMVNLVRLRHIHFDMHGLKIYNVGRLYELRTLPIFEVREEDGFHIEELNNLNQLRGKLWIYSLQFVRDKEEAERANLKEKNNLIELSLQWNRRSVDSKQNDENVMEGLLPPPAIKKLTIGYYEGEKFSNWMSMRINNCLSQLEELSLLNCIKCELMPSLGHLPRLETLTVEGLGNIRIIGSEFYGECKVEVTLFPQLKNFILRNMKNLEEWDAVEAIADNKEKRIAVFPVLEKLRIKSCPRLRSIPLRHLSSLVSLNIESCEDMEYLSTDIQNLPSLDVLEITDCGNLVSLSNLQQVKSLKKLRAGGCAGLTSLPKGLVSLETLEMEYCGDALGGNKETMDSIPISLVKLRIYECSQLVSVPHWIKFCTSLRILTISSYGVLISIDEDIISSLTQLKELELGPFSEKLETFPGLNSIHHLLPPSIQVLRLCGWEKLKSLPPQLQHLTALRELSLSPFKGVSSINDGVFNSLTQLKLLRIGPFSEELDEFPGLNSIHLWSRIERLDIHGWPKLKSLPQQLQHLTSLKQLFICDFNGIETLPDWLAHLSSLQQLDLYRCENLKNLPTSIKSLSNLTEFWSSGCPHLTQRYNQDTGPDRHHISHITILYLG